jgi:hypothetical protein
MKRMNFPERRLKRRMEAESRNARTPLERTKRYRKLTAVEKALVSTGRR